MMYGREPLLPWQIENDLGPLDMSQEVPQVSIEEAIEKMENLHQQVLEVAAGNIKKTQAHQAKTYNAKYARNDFEAGAKVWKKNPLWNTKQKSLKKGPMWRGPYEVEGKTPAGNYLLKGVKGRGKGKVRNTAIPPNQLKRYIARSQNIPAKSDDEYASESDGDDDQSQKHPIGTNSPVSSDADTIQMAHRYMCFSTLFLGIQMVHRYMYVFCFLCAFTVFDVVDFVLILLCKYKKIQMF